MGKVNSHSKGKIWENRNIPKSRVSYFFRVKQKSMQFPKHGMSEFPCYSKSMGKHQVTGFLHISCEAEMHTFPNCGMSEFPYY